MNFEFHCISLSFFFHLSKINIYSPRNVCQQSNPSPSAPPETESSASRSGFRRPSTYLHNGRRAFLKKGNRGSRFGVSASEKLCSTRCRVWPKLLKAAVRFALSALSKSTQIESYIKHGLISFKGLRSRTRVQRNTI